MSLGVLAMKYLVLMGFTGSAFYIYVTRLGILGLVAVAIYFVTFYLIDKQTVLEIKTMIFRPKGLE